MQQKQASKVIPFTGELHQIVSPSPVAQPREISPILTAVALAMIAGISLGAIVTHQSAGYQQINQLKAESKQLQQLKKSICGI
jgi:hypothetical protein